MNHQSNFSSILYSVCYKLTEFMFLIHQTSLRNPQTRDTD